MLKPSRLGQINFLFHHQVPQIDCKRKVYWRPKPRSMEKGSKLIGTRLWRHPVLDQMIGGRVMSCHETGKARRGELKHLKVLLLSSHLKWAEVTCCACVSRLKGDSQTQLSVRTWLENHEASLEWMDQDLYLLCLGIGWILRFFSQPDLTILKWYL